MTRLKSSGLKVDNITSLLLSVPPPQSVPFYRLYSSAQGDHFYTTNSTERDNAVAKFGYKDEGVAAYVFPPIFSLSNQTQRGALSPLTIFHNTEVTVMPKKLTSLPIANQSVIEPKLLNSSSSLIEKESVNEEPLATMNATVFQNATILSNILRALPFDTIPPEIKALQNNNTMTEALRR